MIRFAQTYVQDGQLCGTVYLDEAAIGEFRVDVPQWDDLRKLSVDGSDIWVQNEREAREHQAEQAGVA